MRLTLLLATLLVAGCSADNLYDPQKFFPGKDRHGWSDCPGKGTTPGTGIQICAFYFPSDLAPTAYAMSYHIPNAEHVRLMVYDEHAVLWSVLLDQDMPANQSDLDFYTINWDFMDAMGRRIVPSGDYRLYFRAGDFVSSSDVTVP